MESQMPTEPRERAMETYNIHFLPTVQCSSFKARDVFLQQSEAKSHAAKVSHTRLRRQSRQIEASGGSMGTVGGSTGEHWGIQENLSPVNPTFSALTKPIYIPGSIGCGGLDPFLVIADDLSKNDCMQLQSYLVANTQANHLEGHGPSLCPVRDILLPKLAMSSTMVQCLMLISDLSLGASRLLIHSRRSKLIDKLRKLVEEESGFLQRSTAATLATMIVAEYRDGDFDAARRHAIALHYWVQLHGGFGIIRTLDFFTGMCLLSTFVYFGFEFFPHQNALDCALARMELPTGYMIPTLTRYFSPSDEGTQIAVLYAMSSILEQNVSGFVDQLDQCVGNYGAIPPGAMLYMIGESMMRLGQWPAFQSDKTIEFVRLLSLATKKTRLTVARTLAANLKGVMTQAVDLDRLKEEIRARYLRCRAKRPQDQNNEPRRFEEVAQMRNSSRRLFLTRDIGGNGQYITTNTSSQHPRKLRYPMRCPMR